MTRPGPFSDTPDPDPPRRRRKRYGGTHPRGFAEKYKERDPVRYPDQAAHVRRQGRTPAGTHVPIMLAEVLEQLAPQTGEVVADCTLGYGGHARAFLERIGPKGRLLGFEHDAVELERSRVRLADFAAQLTLVRSNFAGLSRALGGVGLDGCDVVFADLGLSSMQVDDPARGFSYKHDGPLDMRMDQRLTRTAADLLARLSSAELARLFAEYGDEPDAELIADRIHRRRAGRPLTRTADLAALVFECKGLSPRHWRAQLLARLPRPRGGMAAPPRVAHPAAPVFQALRIAVNDELAALRELLRTLPDVLRAGGRVGVLTFHSGEDRLVKRAFEAGQSAGVYLEIAADPLRPGPPERRDNPRCAAAKFRWARRGTRTSAGGG